MIRLHSQICTFFLTLALSDGWADCPQLPISPRNCATSLVWRCIPEPQRQACSSSSLIERLFSSRGRIRGYQPSVQSCHHGLLMARLLWISPVKGNEEQKHNTMAVLWPPACSEAHTCALDLLPPSHGWKDAVIPSCTFLFPRLTYHSSDCIPH